MNNIKYIKNKSTYKGIQVKRLYYYNYNLYYFYVRKTKSNPIFTYLLLYLILIFCQFCCISKWHYIYIHTRRYTHSFFLGSNPLLIVNATMLISVL